MKNLLLLIAVCIASLAIAQEETEGEKTRRITGENLGNIDNRLLHTFSDVYDGLQGHPYYINAWLEGSIDLKVGGKRNNLMLKYDVYENRVIMLKDKEPYAFDANAISGFTLNDVNFGKLRKYRNGFYAPDLKIMPKQFFEVAYDGDVKLLYQFSKKLLKANFDTGLQTGSRYDQFQEDHKLYLVDEQGSITKLKRNKKAILKVLDSTKYQKRLETFIDNKELDFKEIDDVVLLIQYFDSLEVRKS